MIAFSFDVFGVTDQRRVLGNVQPCPLWRWQVRLHANKPPYHLTEIHFSQNVGPVYADSKTRNVDAFSNHVQRDKPLRLRLLGKRLDALTGRRMIRDSRDGLLTRPFSTESSHPARRVVIHADINTSRVR